MKLKIVFMMLSLVLCLFLLSACPGNDNGDTYPDVAGTWDWIVTFTQNACDDGTGYNVILVITQNGGSGTWTSYDDSDTGLLCPLESGTYTMDTDGNVTINLNDYDFDPQDCNDDTPDDATVTIQITALATSTQMTGTQTEYWTSASWGVTNCQKVGNITATKR
jgi:hypothetical protein